MPLFRTWLYLKVYIIYQQPKRNRTRKPKRLKEKPKVADITIYDEISQESLYYEHDVKKNLAPSWKKAAEEARTKRKATEVCLIFLGL